ncbi:hypothetical protein ACP70R_022155 [Stipagrostis hirtigluma subsp. patula]
MDSAGDLDRISVLPDDLLHVILALVGDAAAVTRTAVLSRRWRRVWVGTRGLSFSDTTMNAGDAAGFVDWALAQCRDADMDSLEISMDRDDGLPSPEQVNRWFRYAARHVAGSFHLRLSRGSTPGIIELPGDGRSRPTSIRLRLGARNLLKLPPPEARYEALTELALHSTWLGEETRPGWRALGDFVSSSCPRLRKLDVDRPRWLRRLVLRAEALEELRLSGALDLRTLDVAAPSLRVLQLQECFYGTHTYRDGGRVVHKAARVAAPRLEEVAVSGVLCGRPHLDVHGLSSVRRLGDLELRMHGQYCRDTGHDLWLLESCRGAEHVGLSLCHCEPPSRGAMDGFVDIAAEGAAPFASVRSMVVDAGRFPEHHLVSSMSPLLQRFPCLRSLCIRFTERLGNKRQYCLCRGADYATRGEIDLRSKNHGKILFGSLEEVEISGFAGAPQWDLVSFLFESSDAIKRMSVEMDGAPKRVVPELLKIPSTDRGRWHFEKNMYIWTSQATENIRMEQTMPLQKEKRKKKRER